MTENVVDGQPADWESGDEEERERIREALRRHVDGVMPEAELSGGGTPQPWAEHPPMIGTLNPPSNPLAVMREIMPRWTTEGVVGGEWATVRNWQDTWLVWRGACWEPITEAELVANLYHVTERCQYLHRDDIRPWSPNGAKVADLVRALKALVLTDPRLPEPSWDDRALVVGEKPAVDGALLACQNGLLDLANRRLLPHSPAYLNRVAVPFSYDPGAEEPVGWLRFLESLWDDDPAAVEVLQEWFGYLLSGSTSQQKILLLVGPPRSGKGTIARVMRALVGPANTAGPTMASLASEFGMSTLIGKSLGLIADARVDVKDQYRVLERLLSISGEDTLDVNRKHRDLWTGKLGVRLAILTNSLPEFSDASNAIASRYLTLTMTRSFAGKEDRALDERLTGELPGILNWALVGLDRLMAKGKLRSPESSDTATEIMGEVASPVATFVEEGCEVGVGKGLEVACAELYQGYVGWCALAGRHPLADNKFGSALMAVVPGIKRGRVSRVGPDGKRATVYRGIALRVEGRAVAWRP